LSAGTERQGEHTTRADRKQELLNLSHQILELTKAVHEYAAARSKDART
jgi:hypothetical protein